MKIIKLFFTTFILCVTNYAFTQEDSAFTGTWQGELLMSEELQLRLQFTINDTEEGGFSALISSPDNNAINDIAANVVNVNGSDIFLEFDTLNGSFNGQLVDGRLEGEWSQLQDSFLLVLKPFVTNQLTEAQITMLLGQWWGTLPDPVNFDLIFRFEQDDAGILVGFLDVPAQGVSDFGLDDFFINENNEFSFTIPRVNARFDGAFSESGLELNGTFKQGMELALNLIKGDYTAPNTTLLNLSEADKERLIGNWSGALGPLTIVLRFERDETGEFVSFVDSPTQNATDLQVAEVTFLNDQLSVVLAIGAEFSGEMNGEELVGQWIQGGMTNALTLSKAIEN